MQEIRRRRRRMVIPTKRRDDRRGVIPTTKTHGKNYRHNAESASPSALRRTAPSTRAHAESSVHAPSAGPLRGHRPRRSFVPHFPFTFHFVNVLVFFFFCLRLLACCRLIRRRRRTSRYPSLRFFFVFFQALAVVHLNYFPRPTPNSNVTVSNVSIAFSIFSSVFILRVDTRVYRRGLGVRVCVCRSRCRLKLGRHCESPSYIITQKK